MAKDDLRFKIIGTNPTKNTVTLRPTFGTLLKIHVAAAGLLYVGKLMVEWMLDEREERTAATPEPDPLEN